MNRSDLFYGTSGPHDALIVLVGEAWGAEEAAHHRPFIGASGVELNRILAEAGIDRNTILCTNVVAERPQNNEIWRFFHSRASPSGQPLVGGLDPRDNVRRELERMYLQIAASPRRLVIAAGAYALWALSRGCCGVEVVREAQGRRIPPDLQPNGPTGIHNWRGSMWFVDSPDGLFEVAGDSKQPNGVRTRGVVQTPLLPIIHPAAILRQWSLRTVTVQDLRTRVPMAMRSDWRHSTEPVLIAPPRSLESVTHVLQLWLERADGGETLTLAEDVETRAGMMTCLGLADSPQFALTIPFIRKNPDGTFDSWWEPEQEAQINYLLRRINTHPNIKLVGQNFIYDTQYIRRWLGVTPRLDFDTMLAQNVLFPGTPKALDYLSSLYCRYHWYWKEDAKEWDGKGDIESLFLYNAWDNVRTFEVAEKQKQLISSLLLDEQMKIKMRTNDLCLDMMLRGVKRDEAARGQLSLDLMHVIQDLQKELLQIIPQHWLDPDYPASYEAVQRRAAKSKARKPPTYTFWYTSDKQAKTVYHDILGFPHVANRKTDNPTSGKEAREVWLQKFPYWKGLLERIDMLESTMNMYGVVNMRADIDGRIRCSFNPGGTETHRLSSSKNAFGGGGNLQNLTKGKERD